MLAKRISRIQPSATLAMTAKAAELRAEGKDVLNMSVGEPDFNTPSNIVDAAIQAMKKVKKAEAEPAAPKAPKAERAKRVQVGRDQSKAISQILIRGMSRSQSSY